MNLFNAQRACGRLFTIAQYSAVWPSILRFCRILKNSAAGRAAAQALTFGTTEEGVKSGPKTISRMRDRTAVRLFFMRREENTDD